MRPFSQTPALKTDSFLKFLLHFAFLVSGTITILIGQILPLLSARLSLNDADAGYFFIAQFSGSIIGTFSTGKLVRRFGFAVVTAIGVFLMAGGIMGLNSGDWLFCLAAFFITGVGIGITLPSINMLTVELNPQNVTPALNFLNFFWGVGAVFCKPFVDFFRTPPTDIFTPTAILAALLLPIGLAIIFAAPTKAENTKGSINDDGESEDSSVSTVPLIWTTATAWLIALFNFVHVGFESGIGGWITTYADRLPSQETAALGWFSPTFAYFLFFVVGRLTARFYSRSFSENALLLMSLIVTALGVVILLVGNTLGVLAVGAAIAGFGTSTIFPTNMARFTKTFGETASRRATPLFICGTLGAALTTWLIGFVSTSYNGLGFGMFVLLASCVILIALQILLIFKTAR